MYWLLLLSILISVVASIGVNSTFRRYESVPNSRGMTGAQAAAQLLTDHGVMDVQIAPCRGRLSDHYDPRDNTIYLSEPVFSGKSVAALGVAMHEAGHAVQYAEGYAPVQIRSAIVRATNFSSSASYFLVLLGMIFRSGLMLDIGILLFCVVVFFQIVTLPVEFNASRRALQTMDNGMMLEPSERNGAASVLRAAAMTYVAAVAVAVLQLLRLLSIRGRR